MRKTIGNSHSIISDRRECDNILLLKSLKKQNIHWNMWKIQNLNNGNSLIVGDDRQESSEQDGNLGGDTQKKEEALAAMEDKIQSLETKQMNSLSDIQMNLQEASKVEAEEKRAEKKAEASEKPKDRDDKSLWIGDSADDEIFDTKTEISVADIPPGSSVDVKL